MDGVAVCAGELTPCLSDGAIESYRRRMVEQQATLIQQYSDGEIFV